MFPIDPRLQVQRTQTPTARPAASGARFTLPGQQAEAARTSAIATPLTLDGLVALQANEDSGERRRRRARHGHDLLDGLDRLKASLLAGIVPVADLSRLKSQLEARREASDDPRLEDIIAHIELRVAVEIAKLGR
jgi:hypothetical protein